MSARNSVLVGASAAVVGVLVGMSITRPDDTAPRHADPDHEATTPDERGEPERPVIDRSLRDDGNAPETAAPDRREVVPSSESVGGDSVTLTRARFSENYRGGFRSEWDEDPDQAVEEAAWQRAKEIVLHIGTGLGRQDGRQHAENWRKVEVAERDDVMSLLRDKERWPDFKALRNDPAAMDKLFEHRASGPHVDGPIRLANEAPVEDGTVLTFGPGIHRVSWKSIGDGTKRMPRDLTIRGSGMDRTLIQLSDFSTRDMVWNLHIRDCTIDCANDGAFDLRNENASVLAEDVRFVRFDAGHGGCYVLSCSPGAAFYAKRCIFAGGYGRSPGNGNILRFVKLARFEGCTFERLRYRVTDAHNTATYSRCTFVDCPYDIPWILAGNTTHHGSRVEQCSTRWTIENAEDPMAEFGRNLSEQFPELR